MNKYYTTTTSNGITSGYVTLGTSSLIEERDERTRKRKRIKRKMDSIIGLSYKDDEKHVMKMSSTFKLADNTIRLLDEGYFDIGFVIKKGTLEKYLNGENQYVRGYEMTDDGWAQTDVLNLTSDFVGTVNIGHMDFATFPFIIGEWDKNDLSLVDIENDRKGLDVEVRLDENSVFVQELKRQPFDIGISSEFYYHINKEDTEALSEMLNMYMPVIDEVFIFAYGLVGECGNVNSSGLELKGVDMATVEKVNIKLNLENAEEVKEQIEEVKAKLDETNAKATELAVEELDIAVDEAEEAETEEEDVVAEDDVIENSADVAEEEESVEDADEEDSDEEDEVEEVEDEDEDLDDEDEVDEDDELTEALAMVKSLKAQNAELSNINAELKKDIRRLNKKIAVEKEAKAKFLEETKNLSVELYQNELEAKEAREEELAAQKEAKEYLNGGIADI